MKNLLFICFLLLLAGCRHIEKISPKLPPGKASKLFERTAVKSQFFTLDPKIDNAITASGGSFMVIAKGALVDDKGKEVTAPVTMEVAEALNMNDMVRTGLATVSDGKLLESAGMIYLKATAEGKELHVNAAKPIYLELPCERPLGNAAVFNGQFDAEGKMNWTKSGETDKGLIAVPMADLYKGGDVIKIRKYTSSVKPFNVCGISEEILKSLRDTRFANTFIATREFHDRLRFIKKSCDPAVVKIYVDHINDNLWEADSAAYLYLLNHKSNVAGSFRDFARQRLTKVRNAPVVSNEVRKMVQRNYERLEQKLKEDSAKISQARIRMATEDRNSEAIRNAIGSSVYYN